MTTASRRTFGQAEILARAGRSTDPLNLFAEVSRYLRELTPYDAAVWRVTDPQSGMMAAPIRAENLDEHGCAVYWETELFTENVNLFRDLARAPVPIAGLRQTTGDLPTRSSIYHTFLRPRGLEDELRAVLRIGGRPYGHVSLFRAHGRQAFGAHEIRLLEPLVTPLAQKLRSLSGTVGHARTDRSQSHGLLLFDRTGALISVNDDARAFLEDFPDGPGAPDPSGLWVPASVQAAALRARAIAEKRDRGEPRVRLRGRSGRWLVCHASCLRSPNGSLGPTAVVIEQARTSEILPLIVDAHGLTDRETEVIGCIARGLSTDQIAGQLHLSPHTVRDYIKSVFEKVSVSSRGELVGKLFTEYYSPHAEARISRVQTA